MTSCTKGTYASKIFVQKLYVSMDDFQCHQFIVSLLHSTAKVQTSISKNKNDNLDFSDHKLASFKNIPFVNNFEIFPLQE